MVDFGGAKKVSQDTGATVPFPAIVGQEDLKEVLLAVGANDALDGVLVRGEKGTAKSTAARALADLLPKQRAVADCPYGCPPDDPTAQCSDCRERDDPPVKTRRVPFVTLPLGASRERVVGSLSVSDALAGSAEFNPGLLARANRGILYVDEVNLLDDHLVDVLLDAAATGVNRVERDGVSVTHPADITLIGTMNPEEGDLRPQFRDRFALQVEVSGADDVDDRVRVVEGALSGFDGDVSAETDDVRERLHNARDRLDNVAVPESLLREIAELCRDAGVDGHRADIATARAARTLAALDGREKVIESDVRRAAELALPHRLQSRPFEDAPDPEDVIDDHFEDDPADGAGGDNEGGEADDGDATGAGSEAGDSGEADGSSRSDTGDHGDKGDEPGDEGGEPSDGGSAGGDGEERTAPTDGADGEDSEQDAPTTAESPGSGGKSAGDGSDGSGGASEGGSEGDRPDESDSDGSGSDGSGEATPRLPGQPRTEAVEPGKGVAPEVDAPTATRSGGGRRVSDLASTEGRGGRVRTERAEAGDSVDAAASVRTAATRGRDRVESRDLRKSIRSGQSSTLVVFAVDASASMRGPMRAAKGVALDLLRDAYEHRDEVAVVTFAGDDADVVLPPTDSVNLAARHLKSLPTGDRTPLADGLRTADEVLARADPDEAVVVVVTDGRATAGESPTEATRTASRALAAHGAHVIVVDAGDGQRSNLIPDIVQATNGERIPLDALTPNRITDALDPDQAGESDGIATSATGGEQ